MNKRKPSAPALATAPATAPATTGQVIAARRAALGWSRYRLAKESGVSLGHLSQIERGSRPHIAFATACRIADALGCDPGELRPKQGNK